MESRDLDSNEVCNSCKYNTVIIMFIIATEKKLSILFETGMFP